MANERKQYKSRPRLLNKIASTAGISQMVPELRGSMEQCISAREQPGDGIIDDGICYLTTTYVGLFTSSRIVGTESYLDKVLALPNKL
jgi:hypothetical protein